MKDWQKKCVVYQVYPRSFKDSNGDGIGDLRGLMEKLSYIKDLGADMIWLNPIYCSPNDDNGYDISDYRDIMPEFGTMQDFTELLEKAHALSLKIMMDLVVNHTSDEHPWFRASIKKQGKYTDFYIWKDPIDGHEPNNWGSNFQGSAWEYNEERGQYYLHTFSKKQPDLNWQNPEVREEVYSIMKFWLDKGIDGFRMDVINYISKSEEMPDGEIMSNGYGNFKPFVVNGCKVPVYLQEMNEKVLSHYDVLTVGETGNVTPEHAIKYAPLDNSKLNMIFQFEHMGCDCGEDGKWSDGNLDFIKLKTVLTSWQEKLEGKAWNSLYWDNHDQPRLVSRFGSVKNELLWEKSAKMLATCLFMMKGTPYIFEGDEIGMTNVVFPSIEMYRDIDTLNRYKVFMDKKMPLDKIMDLIHKNSRDNARTPMQWSDDVYAGFGSAKPWININSNYKDINVKKETQNPNSILNFYKKLIKIRKSLPVVIDGYFKELDSEDSQVFHFLRILGDRLIEVFCNFSEMKSKDFDFKGELLIGNYSDISSKFLKPYESRVYIREK